MVGIICPPPVGIGLTDLPNIGGASGPPAPPVPAQLVSRHCFARKISKQITSSYKVIMDYLKENFEQIDIVSAVTFVVDYCFNGVGSLILDGYYRRFKFGSGKLWLMWDCIALALILFHILLDIRQGYSILEYWKGNSTDSLTIVCVQTLFCLKYMEFFWKARLYNGIHRRKYCSVCLHKPKQQIANDNSLIYKYCICVCRKCERFSSNCDACKFTISTHFR